MNDGSVIVIDVTDASMGFVLLESSDGSSFSLHTRAYVDGSECGWDGTVYYSTNYGLSWTTWDYTTQIIASSGSLCLRGIGNTTITAGISYWLITPTGSATVAASGNIEDLLDYTVVASGEHPSVGTAAFSQLFYNCSCLTSAPDIMCTSLPDQACMMMFVDCTSLVQLPRFAATSFGSLACMNIFSGCSQIKLSETQVDEYQIPYRIPYEGTGTTGSASFLNMFNSTGGTFTGTAVVNTTYYLSTSNKTSGMAVEQPTSNCGYITFSSPSSFTLKVYNGTKGWDGTIFYSTDALSWTEWNGTTTLNSSGAGKLYITGENNHLLSTGTDSRWVLTGSDIRCDGNIENLLDYRIVKEGNHPSMYIKCFDSLFSCNTALVSAPSIGSEALPAYACNMMFYNCSNLVEVPDLPATTIADYGCFGMFSGCTSLVNAPKLPATTLSGACYKQMFYGCTSLVSIPVLPATTTLPEMCYQEMFSGCTSLKLSTTASLEYQRPFRIPASGTITTVEGHALDNMFSGTGGSFTGTPSKETYYYIAEPFYFTLKSTDGLSFTLKTYNSKKNWNGTLYYSTNGTSWSTWSGTDTLTASGGTLLLRGTGNKYFSSNSSADYRWVVSSTDYTVSGNIDTLLNYSTVASGGEPSRTSGVFAYLFYGNTGLTDASQLELPQTSLSATYCYYSMFRGCTGLESAPKLPATTLASYCYNYMFYGCTSLTTAPELPATTLATYCYDSMFYNCKNLTIAPELPATTLATYCYRYMFYGCTSLTTAPDLPATTLADYCYASMFYGCTCYNARGLLL